MEREKKFQCLDKLLLKCNVERTLTKLIVCVYAVQVLAALRHLLVA